MGEGGFAVLLRNKIYGKKCQKINADTEIYVSSCDGNAVVEWRDEASAPVRRRWRTKMSSGGGLTLAERNFR